MVLFNLSKWIAKQVTNESDRDMKIYIIGPPGSGKSKTALSLALKIAKWLSWYNFHDFTHVANFFKLDCGHLAVIDSDDLMDMMLTYPELNQIRISDDCGSAKGFNSRTSMSNENIDANSIWSTNRTRRCVTIVTLHDTSFNDLRQVLLSDIVIDLRNFYQVGPFRMAKLWHIKMDKRSNGNRGTKFVRFMTYERGEWVTQESLACMLPPADIDKQYNEIRAEKDKQNSMKIQEKYNNFKKEKEVVDNRTRCPECTSIQVKWREKTNDYKCGKCGKIF